jgi:hypothetical protein
MDKKALKELRKQKREYNNEEEKNVLNRFVMTIGIVLLALVLLYLFIGIFITKTITFGKGKDDVEETVAIDNSTILASKIFEQKDDEYFVLVYDPNEKVEDLTNYISIYQGKSDAIKLYKVDSTKKFNGDFIVTSDSNKNPTSYKELRIISPSLIKISSKSVVEYYEGFEEVKNVFKK